MWIPWIPKKYFLLVADQVNDLERRVKRLELIMFEDAKGEMSGKEKIKRLSSEKPFNEPEDLFPIEEIINKRTNRNRTQINDII